MPTHPILRGALRDRRTTLLAASAVAAGAAALWVRNRARKAERDNPPIGRFIEVDGVTLHYVEQGEGPPVLLLPGNAVVLQDFIGSGLVEALSRRHRVIAFDRPGFGYSGRPRTRLWTASAQAGAIHEALSALGAERPVVLGHSWGTLTALSLALEHPQDVAGLVLVSGYYYPTVRLDVPVVAAAALPVLGDAMRYTVTAVTARLALNGMVKLMFAPEPVPSEFWQETPREMMLRPAQLRADAEDGAFMLPAVMAMHERYGELSMPVRIFAGGGDKIVDPDAHSGRLHRELPASTLTVVPKAGHMVHYSVPGEIMRAVGELSVSPPQFNASAAEAA